MKRVPWILTGLAAIVVAFSGCAKKSTVDTAPLEKSFASADPAMKSSADKAVTAIKAGNYSEALADLQKLAGEAKLTPEQQQAIKDVTAQVQTQLTGAASEAGKNAEKAADDLKKSLPK